MFCFRRVHCLSFMEVYFDTPYSRNGQTTARGPHATDARFSCGQLGLSHMFMSLGDRVYVEVVFTTHSNYVLWLHRFPTIKIKTPELLPSCTFVFISRRTYFDAQINKGFFVLTLLSDKIYQKICCCFNCF